MIKFKGFFNKIESFLLRISFISVLFLIGLQWFISNDSISAFINRNTINGMPIENIKGMEKGIIILRIQDNNNLKDVSVLVNGEIVDNFNKKDEVKLEVYNNDVIEIDGTKHTENVKVKIVGISKNIISPKLNTVTTTSQSIEIISKVILK